jgi:hypothetical protein
MTKTQLIITSKISIRESQILTIRFKNYKPFMADSYKYRYFNVGSYICVCVCVCLYSPDLEK